MKAAGFALSAATSEIRKTIRNRSSKFPHDDDSVSVGNYQRSKRLNDVFFTGISDFALHFHDFADVSHELRFNKQYQIEMFVAVHLFLIINIDCLY